MSLIMFDPDFQWLPKASAVLLAFRMGDRTFEQVAKFCLVEPGQLWEGGI